MRVTMLFSSLALCLANVSTSASAQNVILFIADDVGVDGVGVYGEQPLAPPTPNIDALAAEGVLFRNAWANPICSPTRASILTGLNPTRHGVGTYISPTEDEFKTGLDPTLDTIPSQLGMVGYRSAAFGKYHIGGQPRVWEHPLLVGFDYYTGFIWGGVNYFDWPKTVTGTAPDGTFVPAQTEDTTKYATTDTADDAILEVGRNEPNFLWIAFLAAHAPLHAPPASLHSYDLTGLEIVGNEPIFHKAMVEAMDREIGRILASVDLSDTTVIFIGDNGTPGPSIEPPFVPDHGKFTLFEGGVNVPLIIAGQAVAPAARGQESAALVQSTDLFATILELAGAPGWAPDSVSMVPYLSAPARPSIRSTVYAEFFRPNGGPIDPERHYRAVRNARYKLQRLGTDTDVLYDLVADPFELNPLDLTQLTPDERTAYAQLSNAIVAAAPVPVPGLGSGGVVLAAALILLAARIFGRART